jgi:hypothetical protein
MWNFKISRRGILVELAAIVATPVMLATDHARRLKSKGRDLATLESAGNAPQETSKTYTYDAFGSLTYVKDTVGPTNASVFSYR